MKYRFWAIALALTCFIAGSRAEDLVTPAATQTYGYQEVGPMFGGFVARKPFSQHFSFTVGVQANGVSSYGTGIVWGLAAEATAKDNSHDWLVGIEAAVNNVNPDNIAWIQGINAVIGCRTYEMVLAGQPCLGPNNIQSRALWITSDAPATGWESAIKIERGALMSMPGRPKPTVIDLRSLTDAELASVCLIATATRCITVNDLR